MACPYHISETYYTRLKRKAENSTYLFLTLDELITIRTARAERGLPADTALKLSIQAQQRMAAATTYGYDYSCGGGGGVRQAIAVQKT